jgi:hypothetical protein
MYLFGASSWWKLIAVDWPRIRVAFRYRADSDSTMLSMKTGDRVTDCRLL